MNPRLSRSTCAGALALAGRRFQRAAAAGGHAPGPRRSDAGGVAAGRGLCSNEIARYRAVIDNDHSDRQCRRQRGADRGRLRRRQRRLRLPAKDGEARNRSARADSSPRLSRLKSQFTCLRIHARDGLDELRRLESRARSASAHGAQAGEFGSVAGIFQRRAR